MLKYPNHYYTTCLMIDSCKLTRLSMIKPCLLARLLKWSIFDAELSPPFWSSKQEFQKIIHFKHCKLYSCYRGYIHVPYHHHEKNFILLITINTAFCFKIKSFVFKIKFILCNNPDTTRLLFSINLIKMTGIQNYNMNINMTFCNQVCILTWNGLFYRVFSLRNIEYDHCN